MLETIVDKLHVEAPDRTIDLKWVESPGGDYIHLFIYNPITDTNIMDMKYSGAHDFKKLYDGSKEDILKDYPIDSFYHNAT